MPDPTPELDYLLLEVPVDQIRNVQRILGESKWRQSAYSNYYFRIDPIRPEMKSLRHVHVAHKKHMNSAGDQVSWNKDGTRHDRGNFDVKFKGMEVARAIARDMLKTPDSIVFEDLSSFQSLKLLMEQDEDTAGLLTVRFKINAKR
jgi:hypothetical protein